MFTDYFWTPYQLQGCASWPAADYEDIDGMVVYSCYFMNPGPFSIIYCVSSDECILLL